MSTLLGLNNRISYVNSVIKRDWYFYYFFLWFSFSILPVSQLLAVSYVLTQCLQFTQTWDHNNNNTHKILAFLKRKMGKGRDESDLIPNDDLKGWSDWKGLWTSKTLTSSCHLLTISTGSMQIQCSRPSHFCHIARIICTLYLLSLITRILVVGRKEMP
jgi:hypothetical protein